MNLQVGDTVRSIMNHAQRYVVVRVDSSTLVVVKPLWYDGEPFICETLHLQRLPKTPS
jgi:hypothetical protein